MKELLHHWHGIVAVILALGVAATIVLLAVMELARDGHVTPEEATLLSTALGAGIGAIATYLGGRDYNGSASTLPRKDLEESPPLPGAAGGSAPTETTSE